MGELEVKTINELLSEIAILEGLKGPLKRICQILEDEMKDPKYQQMDGKYSRLSAETSIELDEFYVEYLPTYYSNAGKRVNYTILREVTKVIKLVLNNGGYTPIDRLERLYEGCMDLLYQIMDETNELKMQHDRMAGYPTIKELECL